MGCPLSERRFSVTTKKVTRQWYFKNEVRRVYTTRNPIIWKNNTLAGLSGEKFNVKVMRKVPSERTRKALTELTTPRRTAERRLCSFWWNVYMYFLHFFRYRYTKYTYNLTQRLISVQKVPVLFAKRTELMFQRYKKRKITYNEIIELTPHFWILDSIFRSNQA